MNASDVINIYKLLTDSNIDVWLDGGWGVDALLREETRQHGDVHVVAFDADGNGIYGPKERGVFYPAYSFKGTGEIDSMPVKCLTAEYQVESHTVYEIDENDVNDVLVLCKKFGVALPKEYLQ